MYDPLVGFTPLTLPDATHRTLANAFEVGARALSTTAKETPLDHLRALQAEHPVPHDWEVRLRRWSPISPKVSWLSFRWAAGVPGQPIDRWMLYECTPSMSEEIRSYLSGTPWWELPEHLQPGRRQLVSAYQHEMYRKHRVWARPFWCLQGERGGTPAVYGELEQKLLRLAGQPSDPPVYGSLPFAPFDQRAETAIHTRRDLYAIGRKIDRLNAQGVAEHLQAETEAAEQEFRRRFLVWIADTFAPQVDFLDWYTRKTEADMVLRKTTAEEERAAARHEEVFVTTGHVTD